MLLTERRCQGGHIGIQVKAPHQELGLSPSWVYLEAWWKAHVLGQVILVELSLRWWRHCSQAKSAMLHLSHILLEKHHVVHVLLAGHVDTQVPCHIGLVVTHLAPPSRFAFRLGRGGGPTRSSHMGGGLCRMVVGRVMATGLGYWGDSHHSSCGMSKHLLLRRGNRASILQCLHVVQVLVRLHVDA